MKRTKELRTLPRLYFSRRRKQPAPRRTIPLKKALSKELKNHVFASKAVNSKKPTLECSFCTSKFRTKNTLISHLNSKHPMKDDSDPEVETIEPHPFHCHTCNLQFKGKRPLNAHNKLEHPPEKTKKKTPRKNGDFACSECDSVYQTQASLRAHQRRLHKSTVHRCGTCDYVTNYEYRLKEHEKKHKEPGDAGPVKCDLCDEVLPSKMIFNTHRKQKHQRTVDPENPEAPATYECLACKYRFAKKDDLARHRRLVHLNAGRFYCKLCRKWYQDVSKKLHRLEYHTPVELVCDYCQKKFKTKNRLIQHLGIHDKSHLCHVCGNKYSTKLFLKRHMMRHSKEYKEFCGECGKAFYHKYELRAHMVTHSDERPFVCKICNVSYRSLNYLTEHVKTHDAENRKRFKCTLCDFESFHRQSLRFHMNVHKDAAAKVSCEICSKVIMKYHLKNHLKLHTGEKKEICEYCGRKFAMRKNLIVHWRIHTGEKPHACKLCGKAFSQTTSLKYHMRSHEPKEVEAGS